MLPGCKTAANSEDGVYLELVPVLYLYSHNPLQVMYVQMYTPIRIIRYPISISCSQRKACLLLFYALATSQVTSGRVLTCDSVHSWRLYNAAPLGEPAAVTMIRYSTVILSWYCPNKFLPYHINAKRCYLAKSITFIRLGLVDCRWTPEYTYSTYKYI